MGSRLGVAVGAGVTVGVDVGVGAGDLVGLQANNVKIRVIRDKRRFTSVLQIVVSARQA